MDTCDWEQEIEDVVEQKRVWGNAKGTSGIAKFIVFSANVFWKNRATTPFPDLSRIRKVANRGESTIELFQ
jgi:hypothetical protein